MIDKHPAPPAKRYTSQSGRVAPPKPASAPVKRINDVVRIKGHSLVVTPRPVKHIAKPLTPIHPSHRVTGVMDMKRTPAHLKHHKPEHAKTLMRHAVHKPAVSLRQQLHIQTPTDMLVSSPALTVAPKQSIQAIDPIRRKRAEHVRQSKLISRFGTTQAAQPTWATPAAPAAVAMTPQPVPLKPVAPKNRSMDIFQRALAHANAHEQPAVKPEKIPKAKKGKKVSHRPIHHHTISIITASLAVVLLAGFFAYQNQANLTMRFATAKAGFHATLPGYTPGGFATSGFHYSPGIVSIQYAKAGTSRNYTLSQKVSHANTGTQPATSLVPANTPYQTLEQGGRIIYLYGNGNAAWVSNGVLYQLSSDGNLDTSDLLDIATSV